MAKIMIFNVPAYGHVNVTLPVVYELIKRDHDVLYYCGDELRDPIEKTGATFRPYPAAIPSLSDFSKRAHNLANISVMLVEASETLIPFAIREIEKEKPDVVIYDVVNLWGRVATLLTNTTSIASYSVAILEDVKGLLNVRTMLYMIMAALPKLPKLLRGRARLIREYGKETLQFPLFPSKGQLNLVFLSREFQPDTPFIDDSFRFVGASINPELRTEEPLDLSTLKHPLIYVSLGTVNNNNLSFYQDVIHIFQDFPATFIMSIGQQVALEDLQPIPDNFCVMRHVPQLQVLQYADVFVTHGGMNSVQEALYYGVPQVIVPQQMEQAINGRMLDAARAGIVIHDQPPYGKINVHTLADAVKDVLSNPQYQQQATVHSNYSQRSGGFKQAVDEIETFLSHS